MYLCKCTTCASAMNKQYAMAQNPGKDYGQPKQVTSELRLGIGEQATHLRS